MSALKKFAFVIALTAQQDEVLPTWKIKMISRRLAGPDDGVKPIRNSLRWRHQGAPGSLLINWCEQSHNRSSGLLTSSGPVCDTCV